MVGIRHKTTDRVLHRVEADTLKGATLSRLDLRDADLAGRNLHRVSMKDTNCSLADLSNANLSHADLHGAIFCGANLSGAAIHDTYLSCTDLNCALMVNADLHNTSLEHAQMHGTALRGANLVGAELGEAVLWGAQLADADLTGAEMCNTLLIDCRDLHLARGLEQVVHTKLRVPNVSARVLDVHPGTSVLDVRTLRACAAHLPAAFLLGVGYTPDELRLLRQMYPV